MRFFETREGLVQAKRNLVLEVPSQPRMPQSFLSSISLIGLNFGYPAKEILRKPALDSHLLVSQRGELDALDPSFILLVAHLGLVERVLAVEQHVHNDGA